MDMQALDPRVTWLWRAQALVRVATFWGPLCGGAGVGVGSLAGWQAGLALALVLGLTLLALEMIWPSLAYEHWRYAVREHDLLVEQGVLFRRRSAIPHRRIQHVDTRQGPLERLFGLSQVMVYTAAGALADGAIPGLGEEEANALRDALSRRGGDDGV